MGTIDFASRMLGRMLRPLAAAAALLAACFALLLATGAAARADGSYSAEVIRLVNEERTKAGIPALRQNNNLDAAADVRAEEAARMFSHIRPNGSKWKTIFDEHNIQATFRGENLAFGQPTPREVVDDWMASAEHRKNILNKEFDYMAVGLCERAGVLYWSQLFIQAPGSPSGGRSSPAGVRVGGHARVIEVDLNVHASRGSGARVVAVAEMGSTLTVLDIQSDWAHVQMSDGTKGWVNIKYLVPHSGV